MSNSEAVSAIDPQLSTTHWMSSALHAISNDDSQTAIQLLSENQEVLMADDEESAGLRATLLYYAIRYSAYALIAFMLHFAPAPDIQFYRLYGYAPISYAMEKKDQKVLNLLYPKIDKSFNLHVAVKTKQQNVISALMSRFAFPERLLRYLGI